MLEWFGIIGGFIVVSSYLPQIIKLIKTKRSRDLSPLFLFFIMLGTLFLMIYSFYISDTLFIIINAMASTMAGIVLILSVLYKRRDTNGNE